jgi:hypothetical protein
MNEIREVLKKGGREKIEKEKKMGGRRRKEGEAGVLYGNQRLLVLCIHTSNSQEAHMR